MKKRLHWRLISMLVVLCMTIQLVPVVSVQAVYDDRDCLYIGDGLSKEYDGEPVSIDPEKDILIDGGSVSFTGAAEVEWSQGNEKLQEAPAAIGKYNVTVQETIDYEDITASFDFVIYDAGHEHSYDDYSSTGNYGHYRYCTECEATEYERHSWGDWSSVDNVYSRSCTVCGYEQSGVKVHYDISENHGESLTAGGDEYTPEDDFWTVTGVGEQFDLAPVAEKSGYTFEGWGLDPYNIDVMNSTFLCPDEDEVTLYAIFSRRYNVSFYSKDNRLQGTFEARANSDDPNAPVYIEIDESLIGDNHSSYEPDAYEDWEASGWALEDTASEETNCMWGEYWDGFFQIDGGRTEYYALYNRTLYLKYDANGHSNVIVPSDKSKEQYYNSNGTKSSGDIELSEAGFSDAAESYKWLINGQLYDHTGTVTLDKAGDDEAPSAVAYYVPDSELKTVAYNTIKNGGASDQVASRQAAVGMKADLTQTAELPGLSFVGWNTDPDAHEGLSELTVTDDVTLYAIYSKTEYINPVIPGNHIPTWTVTVYNREKAGYMETVPTPPPYDPSEGWTALGWKNSPDAIDGVVTMEDDKGRPCVPNINDPYYALYSREVTLTYDYGGHYNNNNVDREQMYNASGSYSTEKVGLSGMVNRPQDTDFMYWTDSEGNIYHDGDSIDLDKNITLYANWYSEQQYNVTYDFATNGGTSMDGDSVRLVNYGAAADLTPAAVKEGYEFIGWNTDKTAHEALDSYTVTEAATLYAIFAKTETVRLYPRPGRPQAMLKEYLFNNEDKWQIKDVPAPEMPAGWSPLGWTTASSASETAEIAATSAWQEIAEPGKDIYAVGSRGIELYYDTDDKYVLFGPSEIQYYNGSGDVTSHTFTLETLDDADFAAWALGSKDGQKYNAGDKVTVTETATAYAVWKEAAKSFAVTYDAHSNGGTDTNAKNGEVLDGAKAELSYTASRDGYVFVGWNTDRYAHEGLTEYIVTGETTFYAIFKKTAAVTFNNGDGTTEIRNGELFSNDQTVVIEAPAVAEKEGWKASGWKYGEGENKVIYSNGAVAADRDMTVEAFYTRSITLTYDLNGATTYVEPQTKQQTSDQSSVMFELAAPPTRAGYSFAGWEINGGTVEYKYNGQNPVSLAASATAKALWTENAPAVMEVTVTYDHRTNGGASMSGENTKLITKGAQADLALTAEKTGWDFVGWNTDKDAHEALASVKADGNIALYAIFKKDITARFYSGEIKGEPQTVTAQLWNNEQTANITMPQAAALDGWAFDGYRADIHPKTANYRENTAEISKNTDFYAVYSRELPISFDTAPDQEKLQYYNTVGGAQALTIVSPEADTTKETEKGRLIGYEVTTSDGTQQVGANQPFTVQNAASVIAKYVEIPDGAQLPKVETKGASVSSYTSAELGLAVENDSVPGNEIISKGFVYWSKNDVASKYTVMTDGDMTALSNLAQGTDYYYYAFAENAAGIGKGTIKTFKTDSDKTPNAIMISPEYVAIEKGGIYQLLATLLPETAANREIFWSSSDPSVVTVDASGKLTGVSDGQAIITATTEVGRLTAECIVDVTTKQEAKEYDFSEWHMASHMGRFDGGFDWDVAVDGGNYQMSTAYLARWSGAVQEADDPYPVYDGNTKSKVHKDKDAIMHVQDVEWIPRREGALDNDDIKSALMEYGAVYTTMNIDWSCFSNGDVNYYCNYPTDMNSHAITIVGWDDNYPASRFKTKAPANGAFLCKNSWGSAWGADGYFYISYYDVNLGRKDSNAVFRNAQSANNYNKIYQYDPLGAIGYIGYPETTYAANVFPEEGKTVTGDESLKAVSFYTYQKNTTYDVYIVTDYKDKSSLEEIHTPNVSGTIKNAGYHTIELKTPVEIKKGTRFAVIVKYDTPGQDSYVYFEYPVGGYSSSAKANKGESFMAGDPYLWEDITDYVENADFCIKAFTDNGLASVSEVLYSGVDNENREYESDRVYSLDEARENGCGISDEFIDYMNGEETASLSEAPTLNLGNIPSIAKTGSNTVSFTEGAMFPPSYDLRDMGLVSSVKDQGQWGTCWAHTTYASLESAILKKAKTTHSEGSASEAREIILSRADAIMGSDAAITLAKKILPLNLDDKSVKWISSNDKVVTVDANGTIRSVGDGVASVSASTNAGGKVAECSVIVDNGDIPKSVTLESHALRKDVGEKFMVAYSVNPVTADDKNMTWISDNTNTASVSDNGVIEVVGEGSANISIISEGIIMDTVTVTAGSGFNLEAAEINDEAPGEVSVTAVNGASSDQSTTVMLGIYKGKRLVSAKLTTKVLAPGANTVTIDGISDDMKDGSTYKCMLWNAASDMVPMGAAMTQEK